MDNSQLINQLDLNKQLRDELDSYKQLLHKHKQEIQNLEDQLWQEKTSKKLGENQVQELRMQLQEALTIN